MEPTAASPVVTIPDQAAAFAPGGAGEVRVQWTSAQTFLLYAGLAELAVPVLLPPYGTFVLDPGSAVLFGGAAADQQGTVRFPYALPNDPGLAGLRLGLQGVGATNLPGGLRLSTFQALTVR